MTPRLRAAGMGWPNGPAPNETILALPSPYLLMLAPEARYHHAAAVQAEKTVLWRAIPRVGKRPAELGWSVARALREVLNLTDETTAPITNFVPFNELDLRDERGDGADDWQGLDERYTLLGGFLFSVLTSLKDRLPGARIHFPAWTPDHHAMLHVARWRPAAEAADCVDFHAYDSLAAIEAQYHQYRQAFPTKPLWLTEWHGKGDLAEERRVLEWLARTMARDPLFEAACFFIWRWDAAPGWWSNAYDVEHNPERLALFQEVPAVTSNREKYEPVARAAAAAAGIDADLFVRQINQESGFNPAAFNGTSGATGIAQIVSRFHPNVNPWDPEASLVYAANLMAAHLKKYGGDPVLALSCYNAGPGATASGLNGTLAGWPYAETVRYVSNIMQISQDEAVRRLKGEPANPPPPEPGGPMPEQVRAILTRVITLGKAEIGKRYAGPIVGEPDSYRWGDPGWDCSSFVSAMFARATDNQIKLTPYTETAYRECEWVKQPVPGCIVFYHYTDDQNIQWPHMGIWLSKDEVLDARYGKGVGIHPHVTPVGPDAQGRFRRTMLPKGLANVDVTPPPPPPTIDPKDVRIAELEALSASLRADLDDARMKLGVATVNYAQDLENVVKALRSLKPSE